jgi:hypothetical protein
MAPSGRAVSVGRRSEAQQKQDCSRIENQPSAIHESEVDANAPIAIGIAAEDHAAAQIQAEHLGAKITRGWTGPGT